ncbi:MAG: DUF6152 family protein, partial [Pseudohongiellaceae bacterium]
MKTHIVRLFSLLFTAVIFVVPVSAHNSFAMFDQTQKVEFTGFVREVQWTTPHVWIMV